MSRRLAWSVLPALALCASGAGASAPTARQNGTAIMAIPAMSRGDHLIAIASSDLSPEAARPAATMPVIADGSDTPTGDLGLAAAALANGPVATSARRNAIGNGQVTVATKAKARLPEPATWLMLIGGMYGIGAALRRYHRASEAAFTAKIRSIAAGEDADEA